jgi:hypothetical protein
LAPANRLALPSLQQIPQHYSHEVNGELLYKLCAALTRKGLGSPATWEKCRDCVAFAQFSIMNAIGGERGDLLRRNVEWHLEISDTLSDGNFTGDDDPPVEAGQLCISATCGGAGYFRIGAALDTWIGNCPRSPLYGQVDRQIFTYKPSNLAFPPLSY